MVMKAEVKMSAAGANEQLLQKCASKIKKKEKKTWSVYWAFFLEISTD